MKNKLLSVLLCLSLLCGMLPAFGITASAETKSGVSIGTYTNSEYSSSVTFHNDSTFEFKMNFGEGFEPVKGTWSAEKLDTGETGVSLTVTSQHIGIVVEKRYCFLSDPSNSNVLFLADGNAGIIPADTAFTYSSASTGVSNPLTDESIAKGRMAIMQAVKANAAALKSQLQSAASSGHTYVGYRGLVLDSWAEKEIGMADTLKLMPDEVYDYFHENITREAFATLVHSALLKLTGMTESQLSSSVTSKSFPDCSNQKVGICAGLGIITGDSSGYFRPNDTITRQEAATMLSKLADIVGATGTGSEQSFNDIAGLWGERYMKKTATLKDSYTGKAVMAGTGNGKFSPSDVYSRQQAVVTIVRLVGVTVGTHAGSSAETKPSTMGTYTAVSSAIESKISELSADGTMTGEEIGTLFDYTDTLERQGVISSVEQGDDVVTFKTADGIQGGVVIRRSVAEDGSAVLGSCPAVAPADSASSQQANVPVLLANTSTSSDQKLYLGNNKVLFISSFSKNDAIFSAPMKSAIEEIKKKGYAVTEIYDATPNDYSKMGGGGYGMVILCSHGIMLNQNTFCLATEQIVDAKDLAEAESFWRDGRAYLCKEVNLKENGKVVSVKCKYYLSAAFFSHYLKQSSLQDAYVQLISCSSMKNKSFAQSFLQAGAKAVTGYTDPVEVDFAAKALSITTMHLIEAKNKTLPAIDIGELETAVLKMAGINAFYLDHFDPVQNKSFKKPVLTRFVATGNQSLILGVESEPTQPTEPTGTYEETVSQAVKLLLAGDYDGYLAIVHPDATSAFPEPVYWKKDKRLADLRSGKEHGFYSHHVVNVEIFSPDLKADGKAQVFQVKKSSKYSFQVVQYMARITFQNDGELDPDHYGKYMCGCTQSNLSGFHKDTNQVKNTYLFAIDVKTGKILNCC